MIPIELYPSIYQAIFQTFNLFPLFGILCLISGIITCVRKEPWGVIYSPQYLYMGIYGLVFFVGIWAVGVGMLWIIS